MKCQEANHRSGPEAGRAILSSKAFSAGSRMRAKVGRRKPAVNRGAADLFITRNMTYIGPMDLPNAITPALLDRLIRRLPQWVLSCEEPHQQRGLAGALLNAPPRDAGLLPAAAGLALWAWQERPLEVENLHLVKSACSKLNISYPGMSALLEFLSDALLQDLKTEDFDLLARSGEHDLLLKHGMRLLRDKRQGLFWLARAFAPLLAAGRWDILLAAVDAALPPSAAGPKRLLRDRLIAEAAFCLKSPEETLRLLEGLTPQFWGWWRAQRMAERFLALGRKDKAAELYTQLVQAMPWHVNILLRLDSLLHYEPPPPQDLSSTALLLYSWNKAGLLENTLDCLAGTEAAQARCIVVLDNGSTDETPQVLDKAARGPLGSRLRPVRTRVNVGAPAARNWLLSLEEVRACEFLVFLDDDAALQPGFLHGLTGAARSNPQFGTIGCRIKASAEPGFLQSADYNLSPPQARRSPSPDIQQHVHIFDNCANTPDTGLFTYTRPAAHVSGCCHLLRRETLDTLGGFDVRYSPTQFDDLDRDLRLLASGSSCLYVGEIEVRHVQFSSLAKSKTLSQTGHILGNMVKLASKFDQDEAERMFEANLESLHQHCLQAAKRVASAVR